MKEEAKMKENTHMEQMGTLPAAQNMPMPMPVPETLPAQTMPVMMPQMPMMCCPILMNMQCPMLYGQGMNPMMSGVSPAMTGMSPNMGVSPAAFSPNMGVSPAAYGPNMGVSPAAYSPNMGVSPMMGMNAPYGY